MSDIVERLRRWTHAVDAQPACELMDEAAAELERLRWRVKTLESAAKCAAAMLRKRAKSYEKTNEKRGDSNMGRLTLADEEREAVEWAALWFANKAEEIGPRDDLFQRLFESEVTLRQLLERLA